MVTTLASPANEADLPPVREITVAVPGGDLAVTLAGSGPPLLLLHGWTLDRRMWRPQLALGADFTLIIPDRRGFGASSAAADLAREADDIARIADRLGHERLALAGVSQGAAVALGFALAAPARASALVLAGTPLAGLVPGGDAIPRARLAELARAGDFAGLRAEWLAHPLMQLASPTAQALVAEMLADYRGRDLLAPSVLPGLSAQAIAGLIVPLLAVCGTGDTPWRLDCARYLAAQAPLGALALLPAGHLPSIEQPEPFNACLRRFLAAP